ncbi:MAG: GNAT family N-acetyltransferase [Actinobacteria bacterium]|nr:GNAT family N-acetyltransferase [Actinomycetota bacterium]
MLTTEIDFMNGEGPVVREAQASDAAAIAALQVRSWRAAYRGIVPDAFLDNLAEDAWLERWTSQLTAAGHDGIHQLVSTDPRDGPPRAVAVCGPAMEPTVELTGQLYVLYADPPSWGRGHGGALLRRVHELLAADGHSGAMLWVAADNDRSIEFYEHHGWTKDGETQLEEVAGAIFDEVRMVRELAS